MKKIKILALAIGLLFTGQTFSQSIPKKITSVEGITEYRLENGLRVLIFPDPSKATMTVNVTYLVGSRMEGYGETGMAHLLEHMAFKGSTNHTNIPQELTSHGASPNGSTWYDRTNYFENFSANDDNLNWALSLESDRMVNSFIAKKDLESEFSVVRNEFESGENDPGSVLMERVMSTAYLWHNYGKSTIGSKEDIEKVPIDNLKAFYQKYYQPDNAVLIVAGKVEVEKAIMLVNKYFGPIPRPTRKLQEPYTMEPVQDGERSVVLRRVGDVQVASCGYHIPSGSHPDYAAIDILTDILTNNPSGRLYKALVDTKLASDESGFAFALKDPGFIYFTINVLKEKSLDAAQKRMLEVLDSLKFIPVTQEEVDRAKSNLLKEFNLLFNNTDRVGTLLSEYIAQGDWRLFFIYRDNIEKVKPSDINRVAVNYFKPSNRTLGAFLPDKNPDRAKIPAPPAVDSLVKGYKGKQALAAGEAFDPSPENIDKRTVKGTIPGGAKYALLSKSTRGGSVKVMITLRVGSLKSLENKGEAIGFSAAMLQHGTKTKTFQQINDLLSKYQAELTISGNDQKITVSIKTNKENLANVMSLTKEILRDPIFPTDEFEKLKQSELADLDAQKSEPQAVAFNRLEILTNNYPKTDFRCPKTFEEQAEGLKKLTIDEVKKFYTDFYNSPNATVSVVGDFDAKAVTDSLTAMLANWSSAEKYDRAKGIYFEAPMKEEKIETPDKTNATMAAALALKMRDDNTDYPALVMGNFMLGGGFLNSRLATRIRQKEGLSYGVGSYLQIGSQDEEGGFGSYAIYNPENSAKLITAYKEELDRMLKDGFTADELKDAKSGYLQSRSKNRSSDDYLANRLNDYLNLDRSIIWDTNLEKAVQVLTVEQVNTAVKKWIVPSKITIIQAGDFSKK